MNESALELTNALSVAPDKGDSSQIRGKILALEQALLKSPQLQIEIKHHFAPGLYMREGFLPKGTLLTGAVHKTEHFVILSKGMVLVVTEEGPKRVEASHVIHSKPGIKRAIHALEDSVMINVHHNPNNERDLDKIWDLFVANTFEAYLEHAAKERGLLEQSQGGDK